MSRRSLKKDFSLAVSTSGLTTIGVGFWIIIINLSAGDLGDPLLLILGISQIVCGFLLIASPFLCKKYFDSSANRKL